MTGLFDPLSIGGFVVPNRLAKSAMVEGSCDHLGHPTPALVAMYERWAQGGVGLLVTGMATVIEGWSLTPHELALFDDSVVTPLRMLTDAVHRHGSRIVAQLCHAPPQLLHAKARQRGNVGPSAGFSPVTFTWQRAIGTTELEQVIEAFGAAARRARDAGFDGVQLHAAHGYLLSRFLSPRHNRRRDAFGGDLHGRVRLLRDCVAAAHRMAGRDFPVLLKLNAHDGERRGLTLEDSIAMARLLERDGVAAIEVSAGTGDVGLGFYPNKGGIPAELSRTWLGRELPFLRPFLPVIPPVLRAIGRTVRLTHEAYFEHEARAFADALDIPVMLVGGVRTRATAERILSSSRIAMISLARPLVNTPDLPRRWQTSADSDHTCTSCNRCFVRVGLGEPLRCNATQ